MACQLEHRALSERPRLHQIRVFLSSPGDVAVERKLVREIAEGLSAEPFFRDLAVVAVVSWDDPAAQTPMLAQLTPQEAVNRGRPKPSACDIVVVILWSRMGTPLPDEYRKPDGGRYLSGVTAQEPQRRLGQSEAGNQVLGIAGQGLEQVPALLPRS
jgi:hypothetical protein